MRFLFILLLLFIGCDDYSVSPDVIIYNSFDIEVLQDFIDVHVSLEIFDFFLQKLHFKTNFAKKKNTSMMKNQKIMMTI